jgi:hypothetical protein
LASIYAVNTVLYRHFNSSIHCSYTVILNDESF